MVTKVAQHMLSKGANNMPPKLKFTKDEIISAALEITRQSGISAVTARAVAAKLGCSVKPIFGQFENMQQLQLEVLYAAYALYTKKINQSMSQGKYPPYKASGMAYIHFASQEKELFKLLFMRDRSHEHIAEHREDIRPILDVIMKNLNISEDKAYEFHLQQWVYVHGIATMIATNYLHWDDKFIEKALTDSYLGLKYRYTENGEN